MNTEYADNIKRVISANEKELEKLPDITAGINSADEEIRSILETVKTGIADMKPAKDQEED